MESCNANICTTKDLEKGSDFGDITTSIKVVTNGFPNKHIGDIINIKAFSIVQSMLMFTHVKKNVYMETAKIPRSIWLRHPCACATVAQFLGLWKQHDSRCHTYHPFGFWPTLRRMTVNDRGAIGDR